MNYNKKAAYGAELLINYGIANSLIDKRDVNYVRNRLIAALLLDKPYEGECSEIPEEPSRVLEDIMNAVAEDRERAPLLLPDNTVTFRDLLDTALMGCMTPMPSQVIDKFEQLEKSEGIKSATDYFYSLALNTNYIRRDRIAKNKMWHHESRYANLTITINLTKPEKDPKEIAKLKLLPQSGYPKCLLCPENEGYKGTANNPARQNHRIIPLSLNNESWSLQYSPYVYYNEHCIVLRNKHVPMKIEHDTFVRLLEFCQRFPHYFIGSNADLPIVGGSILTHDHFQGGNCIMPMFEAKEIIGFKSEKYKNTDVSIINWPMSTVKFKGTDIDELIKAAYELHCTWMNYSDAHHDICAYTDGIRHNTVTPIVRKEQDKYCVYCVLRNNRTSPEHPDGIFHPHKQWHHIKKENIGLIEVMGYFILPGRLDKELSILAEAMVSNTLGALKEDSPAYKHVEWAEEIMLNNNVTSENVYEILQREIGNVCTNVLEDSGVFKTDAHGIDGFCKFMKSALDYKQI